MMCDQRLQLLDRWSKFAAEYFLTAKIASKAATEPERFFFRAAMDDTRLQTVAARVKLDQHRAKHGC
jgi:hypothetical protein